MHETSARSGCAAGRGPKASCKHTAALCYALATRVFEFQSKYTIRVYHLHR